MLSNHEILEQIKFISESLDDLAAGDGSLSACVNTEHRFEALRNQYRQHPQTLTGHTQQLSELSRRFEQLLDGRLAEIVDRFHVVNEQLRLIEEEKLFWRSVLIRQSAQYKNKPLTGKIAAVRVRTTQTR